MSTAPVARDIVEIFERHGEWREQEVQRFLDSVITCPYGLSAQQKEHILGRTRYKPNEEMVQYWGFVCDSPSELLEPH
jgi:hypothetical protein